MQTLPQVKTAPLQGTKRLDIAQTDHETGPQLVPSQMTTQADMLDHEIDEK